MVRAAAAEVRFGDERANTRAEFRVQRVQLFAVRSRVERSVTHRDVEAFAHREADEAHAWIALAIGFRAGHGAGKTLLTVKTETRSEDHVTAAIAAHRAPQRLLDRFRSRGGPHDLFESCAAGLRLQEAREPLAGLD